MKLNIVTTMALWTTQHSDIFIIFNSWKYEYKFRLFNEQNLHQQAKYINTLVMRYLKICSNMLSMIFIFWKLIPSRSYILLFLFQNFCAFLWYNSLLFIIPTLDAIKWLWTNLTPLDMIWVINVHEQAH